MAQVMFSFSADPIHKGHVDIITRASKLFDSVVAGIGFNSNKKGKHLFTLEERTNMAKTALSHLQNVSVVNYEGMTVDYAYNNNISGIIRAARNGADFDYEATLDANNKEQGLNVDTVLLPANPKLSHISSTAAKEIQAYHGNVHEYVPFSVKQALEAKISKQFIIGITGESGCGKSYLSEKFAEIGKQKSIPAYHIEFDHIGHQILCSKKKPVYQRIQNQVIESFGEYVKLPDGMINRSKLGEIVFNDYSKLQELNEIMKTPMLVDLRETLNGQEGLIIINGALIAEANLGYLCNNNVVLINVDKETQKTRLSKRDGITPEQIKRRLESQYTFEKKKRKLRESMEKERHGNIWIYQSKNNSTNQDIEKIFDEIADYFSISK